MRVLKYIVISFIIIYMFNLVLNIDNIDRATAERIYSKSHYYNYDPK